MRIFKQTQNLGMVEITNRYLALRTLAIISTLFIIAITTSSFIKTGESIITLRDSVVVHDTVRELAVFRPHDLIKVEVPRNTNIPTFCNNPGALRPSSIPEVNALSLVSIETPSGPFLYFPNKEHGFKALEIVLRKVYWNKSIADMLKTYAPDFENNTGKYTKDLAEGVGVAIHTKVKDCNLDKLMKVIAKIEGFKK